MGLCGIYFISNKVNGKRYIGSSKDIEQRFRAHRSELNRGVHRNVHLLNAWNKYGEESFEFSVVEECDEENRFAIEQRYLSFAEDDKEKYYNISFDALFNRVSKIDVDIYEVMEYWINNGTLATKKYCYKKYGISAMTTNRRIKEIKKLTNKRPPSPKKKILNKKQLKTLINYWKVYGTTKTKKFAKKHFDLGESATQNYINTIKETI